jgi:hypothetical protein
MTSDLQAVIYVKKNIESISCRFVKEIGKVIPRGELEGFE